MPASQIVLCGQNVLTCSPRKDFNFIWNLCLLDSWPDWIVGPLHRALSTMIFFLPYLLSHMVPRLHCICHSLWESTPKHLARPAYSKELLGWLQHQTDETGFQFFLCPTGGFANQSNPRPFTPISHPHVGKEPFWLAGLVANSPSKTELKHHCPLFNNTLSSKLVEQPINFSKCRNYLDNHLPQRNHTVESILF